VTSPGLDVAALIAHQALDREMIERLKGQDPQEIRDALAEYLPDERVEAIMKRIATLVDGLGGEGRKT
jgi:cytochrome c553